MEDQDEKEIQSQNIILEYATIMAAVHGDIKSQGKVLERYEKDIHSCIRLTASRVFCVDINCYDEDDVTQEVMLNIIKTLVKFHEW